VAKFENNSEEFITGTVFESVGIDVLNLKELGLDLGFVFETNADPFIIIET
jgi:hypothetical protein